MTGILSQLITLVTYGNDYLMNGRIPQQFYPSYPAFKFCNAVDFLDCTQERHGVLVAGDPVQWFGYLKEDGCKALRLYFQYSDNQKFPDYQSAGMVGGGGSWHIEAHYGEYCNIWLSRWQVTQKDDPQKNIWTTHYIQIACRQQPTHMPCDLEAIKRVSMERFDAISRFAATQQLDSWHRIFSSACNVLNSEDPAQSDFQRTMIPEDNYSLIARQLLFAAVNAWVFGTMGSWNDLGFQDAKIQQQYEQLTYDLYDNVCVNILASVNSY